MNSLEEKQRLGRFTEIRKSIVEVKIEWILAAQNCVVVIAGEE